MDSLKSGPTNFGNDHDGDGFDRGDGGVTVWTIKFLERLIIPLFEWLF